MRSARVSGIFLKMAAVMIAYITYNLSVNKVVIWWQRERRENGWNVERKQEMGIGMERENEGL